MNACLAAACAARNIARRKDEKKAKAHHSTEEPYYTVTLRKYFYFQPTVVLTSTEPASYPKSYDSVIPVLSIKPTAIGAKTCAMSLSFSIPASKCPNGIDSYIIGNLPSITTSKKWLAEEEKVLTDYVSELNMLYNITLDYKRLNYTTEYCWEVK